MSKLLEGTSTVSINKDIPDLILQEIKSNGVINFFEQKKIEIERLKILSHHKTLKRNIVETVGKFTTNTDISELFKNLYNQTSSFGDKYEMYAVLIDIIAERMQEELLEELENE